MRSRRRSWRSRAHPRCAAWPQSRSTRWRNIPRISFADPLRNWRWSSVIAAAITSARPYMSDDISPKAPTTGARTWPGGEPYVFISAVMGPSSPAGVPNSASISLALRVYSAAAWDCLVSAGVALGQIFDSYFYLCSYSHFLITEDLTKKCLNKNTNKNKNRKSEETLSLHL